MKEAQKRHEGVVERQIARDISLVEPEQAAKLRPMVEKVDQELAERQAIINRGGAKKKQNGESGMEWE